MDTPFNYFRLRLPRLYRSWTTSGWRPRPTRPPPTRTRWHPRHTPGDRNDHCQGRLWRRTLPLTLVINIFDRVYVACIAREPHRAGVHARAHVAPSCTFGILATLGWGS
jgi:hypothetical protein